MKVALRPLRVTGLCLVFLWAGAAVFIQSLGHGTSCENEASVPHFPESPDRRGYNAKHYRRPDGSYQAVLHVEPVHYKTPDGRYEDIDTRVLPEVDPQTGQHGYEVTKGLYQARFPNRLLSGVRGGFVYLSQDEQEAGIAFKPLALRWLDNERRHETLLSEAQDVPGEAQDYVMAYPEAYGPGLGLEYVYKERRFAKEVVIESPEAIGVKDHSDTDILEAVFEMEKAPGTVFKVDGKAWGGQGELKVSTQGSLEVEHTGQPCFKMPAAIAYEAQGPMEARTENGRMCPGRILSIEVVLRQESGRLYLIKRIPAAWLKQARYPVRADTQYSNQPAASAGVDATIDVTNPTNNNGINNTLSVGSFVGATQARRSLIRFDLSSIPTEASCDDATLTLVIDGSGSGTTRTLRVYRMKQGWVEGTKNNAAPADGATWNTYDGTNAWATSGGFGSADAEQTDIGNLSYPGAETAGSTDAYTLTPSKVQDMFGSAFTNNGWLVKADTENSDLFTHGSSDHGTATWRPKLVINYDNGVTLPGTDDYNSGNNNFGGTATQGCRKVVRDSNGYWYVAWEGGASTTIMLAYTTTSTPTLKNDWGFVTLVDSGNTGVIKKAPANTIAGSLPALAMGNDDRLQVMWQGTSTTTNWTECLEVKNLTLNTAWVTPVVAGLFNPYSGFALDGHNVAHVVGSNHSNFGVDYCRFDTSTTSFFAVQTLSSSDTSSITQRIVVACDLDNNVYVAWAGGASPINHGRLLASTNAWTTSTPNATWKNLAQTTTAPDVIPTGTLSTDAPTIGVDYNGIVHVCWADTATSYPKAWDGRIGLGWDSAAGVTTLATTKVKVDTLNVTAVGDGSAYAFYVHDGAATTGPNVVYSVKYTAGTVFRTFGSWGTEVRKLGFQTGESEQLIVEQTPPRNQTDLLWLALAQTNSTLRTGWLTGRQTVTAGWRPPIQVNQTPHPHLTYVFPNTAKALSSMPPPTVAQLLKGAVYLVNSTGNIYAIDQTYGTYARSYTLSGSPNTLAVAAYSSNIHLFVQQDSVKILKLIDDGNAIKVDTNWGNNPRTVANVTAGKALAPLFYTQSGTRYLYMVGARDAANVANVLGANFGLYKLYADSGNLVTGFPVGSAYAPSTNESLVRIFNDQVYMAGNISQVYQVQADGSGEITSTALKSTAGDANAVRHVMLTRTNNDFFVSPGDNYVYRLTSTLLTSTWTSGRSTTLTGIKTSGAYMNPQKSVIFVGVGNQLYSMNLNSGNLVANWPMGTAGNIVTLPQQWKTFVYFGTDTGILYAVNATSNIARANWPVTLDTTNGTPKVKTVIMDPMNNRVYFSTDEGRVYRFSLE